MIASTVPLGAADLALAAVLLALHGALSIALQLGLERRIAVAAARATVQLIALGFVLDRVFAADAPGWVLLLVVAMALLAGWEAVRRTRHRVRGGTALASTVMLAIGIGATFYGTGAVVGVAPWWSPRYVIPILGMVLGNTLTGISLGLETALAGFRSDRGAIEVLLAHGASRADASRDVVRRAVRTGSIPILNAMVAAGLISIPGMMTGQILGGEDPGGAARYQLFILFVIAGATALGTTLAVLGSVRLVFDERDRLRVDRIRDTEDPAHAKG